MKRIIVLLLLFCSTAFATSHWCAVYWPGYEIQNGISNILPPWNVVDWSAFTEIMYFSIVPTTAGDIDTLQNGITTSTGTMLCDSAHAHSVKVIITLGGAGSESAFLAATDQVHIDSFVTKVVRFYNKIGADGIDIDWEALNDADSTNFYNLLDSLRTRLPSTILATVAFNPKLDAKALTWLDQVNIASYDLAGAYPGWYSWYNGCLHLWGPAATNGAQAAAAIDTELASYLDAGIPAANLSIGSEFGGSVWIGGRVTDSAGVTKPGTSGVTVANETWSTTAPTVYYDVPLYWTDGTGIMQRYYLASRYHWDNTAVAPYLSRDTTVADSDFFISYDNDSLIVRKFQYAASQGLGGMIFWTMKMGYPENGTYPALQTIATQLASWNSGSPALSVTPTSIAFGTVTVNSTSAVQSYLVTGSNLSANVTVTAPTGFTVASSSSGSYQSSITLTESGGTISKSVYCKFSPTIAGPYTGNISNASTGAVTDNVALSGTGKSVSSKKTPYKRYGIGFYYY